MKREYRRGKATCRMWCDFNSGAPWGLWSICSMTDQNECKRRMMTRPSLTLSMGLVPSLASSNVFKHSSLSKTTQISKVKHMFEYSCDISVGRIYRIWLRVVVWFLMRVHLNSAQLTLLPARSFSPGFGLLRYVTVFVHVLGIWVWASCPWPLTDRLWVT